VFSFLDAYPSVGIEVRSRGQLRALNWSRPPRPNPRERESPMV
jgi:hypothetical protein